MEPKPRRSIGLIIRRFFALFILFSTISGVVSAVETNSFNDDVIGGLFVSLLIVYYLARSLEKIVQELRQRLKIAVTLRMIPILKWRN